MSKSKKPPVDRAVATIRQPSGTDALKASCTATVTQAMKASPNWAAATDVQTAVAVWSKDGAALAANATTIANLRAQLATAESLQLTLRRDWSSSRQQVISTVTVFCGGSDDILLIHTGARGNRCFHAESSRPRSRPEGPRSRPPRRDQGVACGSGWADGVLVNLRAAGFGSMRDAQAWARANGVAAVLMGGKLLARRTEVEAHRATAAKTARSFEDETAKATGRVRDALSLVFGDTGAK
jgi:hypothetical protein